MAPATWQGKPPCLCRITRPFFGKRRFKHSRQTSKRGDALVTVRSHVYINALWTMFIALKMLMCIHSIHARQ